ncbi:MAG: hypothetical protein ACRDBG_08360 [Waterburya sp.]
MLKFTPQNLPYIDSLDRLYQNNRTELHIPVSPNDYIAITEGNGINLEAGYNLSVATVNLARLGFRVNFRDELEDLRILFQELKDRQIVGDRVVPIAVKDYLYRHNLIDRAAGYRSRNVVIVGEIEEVGGAGYLSAGKSLTSYYGKGFAVKFLETEPIAV